MKDLYILVHVDKSTLLENRKIAREIAKIRKNEKFIEVMGNPCRVNYKIPKHDRLFVCGFYHGFEEWDHRCVDEQIKALRRKGYSPQIYFPATRCLNY